MDTKRKIFTKSFWVNQNFFKELTVPEHIIIWLGCGLTLVIFILGLIENATHYEPYLTFVAAILNYFSIGAMLKKKPISMILGFVAAILLAPASRESGAYAIYLLRTVNAITMIISFILWIAHMDRYSNIKVRTVRWYQSLIYGIILGGLIVLYTWVEGLQSYQNWMSGEGHAPIPPWYFRLFDSASLIIGLGVLLPLALRLKNVLILYVIGCAFQSCTWISRLVLTPYDEDVWIMLINTFVYQAMNILCIISWWKKKKSNSINSANKDVKNI